ncbi:MAG TPA: endonuclease/exonuclease/phosphatase family protein [Bryobacteraceae bacterium]|nr:endonuclease/exonuclease/phosphatase family protein [Bryobacteraceae bacterium]
MTLNMAKETATDRIVRELRETPAGQADLLLLQEVKQAPGQGKCSAEQLASSLGMHAVYSPAETGVTDQGLAIVSRFPLHDVETKALKRYDLRFRSRSRIVLAATMDTPWGPVRVVNTHLDTRVNAAQRLEQLQPVIHSASQFKGPRIVGGDFNSNPFYWVANVIPFPALRSQALEVNDFMTGNGFRSAVPVSKTTFDYLRMHLDWIWLQGLDARESAVYPLAFSDHHAVLTRVEFPSGL